MGESESFQRWYDSRPKMSQAARLMFAFPDEIQTIISEATLFIADREFRENERERSVRSLGREKVLGLHKSKNRRREYDDNPHLHQAMNYLYVLSEDNREFIAEHILKMVRYIQHYLETCQITEIAPRIEEVAEVTRMYVQSGEKEVEIFLKKLREEFLRKMIAGKSPNMGEPKDAIVKFLDDMATQDRTGMKISRLDSGF